MFGPQNLYLLRCLCFLSLSALINWSNMGAPSGNYSSDEVRVAISFEKRVVGYTGQSHLPSSGLSHERHEFCSDSVSANYLDLGLPSIYQPLSCSHRFDWIA